MVGMMAGAYARWVEGAYGAALCVAVGALSPVGRSVRARRLASIRSTLAATNKYTNLVCDRVELLVELLEGVLVLGDVGLELTA